MMTCAEVAEVLQTYLDGELEASDRPAVAAHLQACRRCGLEEAVYERIKVALARPSDEEVDPAVIERLRRFGSDLSGEAS
jgi:anti-sigma factor RsiW